MLWPMRKSGTPAGAVVSATSSNTSASEQIVVETLDPHALPDDRPCPRKSIAIKFDARGVQPQRESVIAAVVLGEPMNQRDSRERPWEFGSRLPAMQEQFDALTRFDGAGRSRCCGQRVFITR